MCRDGSRTWFFPDGDIPPPGDHAPYGHESLLMLNPNDEAAEVRITVYFEDAEPVELAAQAVGAQRVLCLRISDPVDGYQNPHGQYALKLVTTVPLVCQIGRMDVQQPNLAYYTVMGHAAD